MQAKTVRLFLLIFTIIQLNQISGMKKEMSYLNTKVFSERLLDTAKFIEHYPLIIEIGGGSNTIDKYIDTKKSNVIVIDPVIKNYETSEVQHIRKKFQEWDDTTIKNCKFAVVILGLDLVFDDNAWKKLYTLIDQSTETVIEFSSTYRTARDQFKTIKKNINKEIKEKKFYDFSESFPSIKKKRKTQKNEFNVPTLRELYLLGAKDNQPKKQNQKDEDYEV